MPNFFLVMSGGSILKAMLLILLMIVGVQSGPVQPPTKIITESNIISKMKNEFGGKCSFPPSDVISKPSLAPFITTCDRATPENPYIFDVGLYLCMALYDASLRINGVCGEDGLLNDKLPQNATYFNALLESFSKNKDFSNELFCNNLNKTLTPTPFNETAHWVSILNGLLSNEKKCKKVCFNYDDKIEPLCKILLWANSLLKTLPKTPIISKTHQHQTEIALNVNNNDMKMSLEGKRHHKDIRIHPLNAQEEVEPPVAVGAVPGTIAGTQMTEVQPSQHTEPAAVDAVPTPVIAASNKVLHPPQLTEPAAADASSGNDDKHKSITKEDQQDSGDAEREQPGDSKSLGQASTGPNEGVEEPKETGLDEPKVSHTSTDKVIGSKHADTLNGKTIVGVNANSGSLPTYDAEDKSNKGSRKQVENGHKSNDGEQQENHETSQIGGDVNSGSQSTYDTEDKSNKGSRKQVENGHKSNDGEQQENHETSPTIGEVSDTTSPESPLLSVITPPNVLKQPSSKIKLKESFVKDEGKATTAGNKGQDDTGIEPEANVGSPSIDTDNTDSEELEMRVQQQDGDVTLTEDQPGDYELDRGKLPAETDKADKDTGTYVKDKFVDAEDSNFFAYFMAMIVLCIVGYLVFHNKQKILALAVEGRSRKNSRRRPNTSGYRKLDSNLEEAVSSPCSTSVTHVIY